MSSSDSDYLTFSLPAGTQTYNLDWIGEIGFSLTVNGTTVTWPGMSSLPAVDTTHPYVLKITAEQWTAWKMTVSIH